MDESLVFAIWEQRYPLYRKMTSAADEDVVTAGISQGVAEMCWSGRVRDLAAFSWLLCQMWVLS